MQLSAKFGLAETAMLSSLFLSMGMLYFLNLTTARHTQLLTQTVDMYATMNTIHQTSSNLLTSQDDLAVLRAEWMDAVDRFKQGLDAIKAIELGSALTADYQVVALRELMEMKLETIYTYDYTLVVNQLNSLVANEVMVMTEENSLLTRHILSQVVIDTQQLIEELAILNFEIQSSLAGKRYRANQVGGVFVLLTLVLAVIVFLWIPDSIVRRINKFREAMGKLANGDFSYDLNIESGDELEVLSNNYNFLKDQLQTKMNSVLNFMISISSSLGEDPAIEDILQIITTAAREHTHADGAALYLIDSDKGSITSKAISGYFPPPYPLPAEFQASEEKGLELDRGSSINVGEHTFGTVVREAQTLFIRSMASMDEEKCDFYRLPDDPLCIESCIIVPLVLFQRVFGAIVVIKRPSSGSFTDLDFTHMQTFADYAALTIENTYKTEELIEHRERHREISIAAEIQKGLLPKKFPHLKTTQISAFSRAARGISGDYFDVFRVGEGKIGVVVCDVVGKGVPASLQMVMIRTILRLALNPNSTPKKYLSILNKGIMGRIGTDQFATLGLFLYDENRQTITYANAAHPPLLLYRADGQAFIELDAPGLPIGVELSATYEDKTISVEKGDSLVFYTDGIPEARSREKQEYSDTRFRNHLRQSCQKSAREMVDLVKKDIDHFSSGAEQHDDQTIIVMKIV